MKKMTLALALGALVASAAALTASEKKAVAMMAGDMAWKDNAAMKGSQWAALWGDPATGGAWGAYKKVPAGTELPAHTHKLDSRVVMMKGTMTLSLEGAPGKVMAPMSYGLIPGGMVHSATCGKDSECIYMEQMDGPYDFVLAPRK